MQRAMQAKYMSNWLRKSGSVPRRYVTAIAIFFTHNHLQKLYLEKKAKVNAVRRGKFTVLVPKDLCSKSLLMPVL